MIDHAHGVFRESASGKDLFIDPGFQLWTGIDLKPLVEQEAFHKDQGQPGLIALSTPADGVVFHGRIIDAGPINDGVDLCHSSDGLVLFDGRITRSIGKGEIGFHSLEAHSISSPEWR